MRKDEILEKSRQAGKDEGNEYAENQGRKIGSVVFVSLCVVLIVLSLFFWQMAAMYAVQSMFWAYLAAEAYGKFRFAGKKAFLVTAVAGGVASIVFVVNFVLAILR